MSGCVLVCDNRWNDVYFTLMSSIFVDLPYNLVWILRCKCWAAAATCYFPRIWYNGCNQLCILSRICNQELLNSRKISQKSHFYRYLLGQSQNRMMKFAFASIQFISIIVRFSQTNHWHIQQRRINNNSKKVTTIWNPIFIDFTVNKFT